jgi:hypothetical protein
MKSHEVSCVGGKTHTFLDSDAIVMNGSVFAASALSKNRTLLRYCSQIMFRLVSILSQLIQKNRL